MHISLDQAIGRQPRLNRVGQSLLNIASGASAAYSLRSLTGDEPKAVRIRRDGDNEERDFTTTEIGTEAADWTNGKQETTLPADVATSAAAYSLRKVKSDYTGPAVRIRRESDDVEVNVSFDTNDEVSTSSPIENTTEQGGESGSTTATTLGEFISGTNAAVHTWYDQSGSSNNATQEADANQPLIAQSGSLFADGIEFESGVQLSLSGSGLDIFKNAPNGHIFSVIKPGEQGTSNKRYFEALIADGSGARFLFGDGQDVNATFRIGGRSLDSDSFGDEESPTSPNGALSVMTGFLDYQNAEGFLFLNGTQVATNTIPNISGSNTSNTSSNKVAIGASTSNLTADFFAKEFIIYNTDQTANRFKIESNINNHYTIYTAAQNGFVNTWYDQSGNSKNATAEADADEPEIVKNGSLLTDSGGRPEIQFDGTSHHFNVDFGSDLDQPNTIVMVNQSDTTTAAKNEFFDREGTSDNPRTLFDQVTSNNYRMLAQATGDTGVAIDTNKNLVVALYNGSSSVLTKNGTAGSAFNSGTQGINQNSEIGRSDASSGNYDGTMQEFIVYNANQSSVQTALEANIKNHYGIS